MSTELFEHFLRDESRHGPADPGAFTGAAGGAACGDLARVSLSIADGRVDSVSFDAEGCGATRAATAAVAEMVDGDTVLDAARIGTDEVDAGNVKQLAFVLPPGPVWPLPLYELALLTAARGRGTGRSLQLDLVIPGPRPLAAFGGDAGDVMTRLLSEAGITLHVNSQAAIPSPHRIVLRPGETVLGPDRIVSLQIASYTRAVERRRALGPRIGGV